MSQDRYAAIISRLYPGAELVTAEPLSGGVSADVLRLDIALPDGHSRSVVLRVHGTSHHGHPAELEYQLLATLHSKGLPIPEPLLVDASGKLLAEPFLVIALTEGGSEIPASSQDVHINAMADMLARIHHLDTSGLSALPARLDPLPEVFDYLPSGVEWDALTDHLHTLTGTTYTGPARLLHGDFWPGNLLWKDDAINAVLDWEDAALGDPLSDVACCQVELRYKFGRSAMQRFLTSYEQHGHVDRQRLALWQVYVAAAAQRFMGDWGLEPSREAHMRREALASVREAGAVLIRHEADGASG
ncbi:MAG: phosphotransferase family protein [Pseudomonadales bacterium]